VRTLLDLVTAASGAAGLVELGVATSRLETSAGLPVEGISPPPLAAVGAEASFAAAAPGRPGCVSPSPSPVLLVTESLCRLGGGFSNWSAAHLLITALYRGAGGAYWAPKSRTTPAGAW